MARPREFDESEVLDAALGVFWRLGYEGAAISDLERATQLKRQSLYNLFADKHGLFLAALERYRYHVRLSLVPLDRADAGLPALRRYLEAVLAQYRAGKVGACFLVKTAFGAELDDARIREAVQSGSGDVRARFEKTLGPRAGHPRAAYLFSVMHGLSALVRTSGSEAQISSVLDQTFVSLKRRSS